jgi:hypothetical protein
MFGRPPPALTMQPKAIVLSVKSILTSPILAIVKLSLAIGIKQRDRLFEIDVRSVAAHVAALKI